MRPSLTKATKCIRVQVLSHRRVSRFQVRPRFEQIAVDTTGMGSGSKHVLHLRSDCLNEKLPGEDGRRSTQSGVLVIPFTVA